MRERSATGRVLRLGIYLALVGMTWFAHRKVQGLRQGRDLPVRAALGRVLTTGEMAGATVLGGFRAIAINVVWIRLLDRMEEERYEGLPALFAALELLQGGSPSLHVVLSNFMVFDIPRHLLHRPEERWAWIRRGMRALDRALERFPGNLALLRQREFLYFQRFRHDLFPADRERFLAEYRQDPLRIARETGEEAVGLRKHPFDVDWNLWIIYRHEYRLLAQARQGGPEALDCLARAERLLSHARETHRGDPDLDQFLALWREQIDAERRALSEERGR